MLSVWKAAQTVLGWSLWKAVLNHSQGLLRGSSRLRHPDTIEKGHVVHICVKNQH